MTVLVGVSTGPEIAALYDTPPGMSVWSSGGDVPIEKASPGDGVFCAASHGSTLQLVNPYISIFCPLEAMMEKKKKEAMMVLAPGEYDLYNS